MWYVNLYISMFCCTFFAKYLDIFEKKEETGMYHIFQKPGIQGYPVGVSFAVLTVFLMTKLCKCSFLFLLPFAHL